MPGISSEVYQLLRTTLLSCGPFGSDQALQAVFVDARIHPWRKTIPQANSEVGRVDALISHLIDRQNVEQENALVLFLRVLSERMDPDDICHHDLAHAADRLEAALKGEEPVESKPRQPDVYAYYEAGLHEILQRMEQVHPRYAEAQTYQQRLEENIAQVRTFGDTQRRKTERTEILAHLNRLATSALGIGLGEFIQSQAESEDLLTKEPMIDERVRALPSRMSRSELLHTIEQAVQDGRPLLDLADRGLTELPSEIGSLTNLERLDLSGNLLEALPETIANLSNLQRLDLRYNPFLPIPPEILERVGEPAVIIEYYQESQAEAKQQPLNEAKVILVGQGGVGKTSLVKRLIEDDFDPDEIKTDGIDVKRWPISVDGETICLNIWDFGGQEIMHATHQFFLTRRSLYLLVLDARKGEQESNLEYWLKLIQSFGEESPIIVVVNKTDQHPLDLNRRGLREKYPTIKAFVNTSCKHGTGIDELTDTIQHEVSTLPHIHIPWLKDWFAVKRRLETMERDYIPYDTYWQICVDAGIQEEKDQRVLIGYLHDLGVILNYRDDPRLEETNILNPEWVTGAVYKILNNHTLFHNNGVLFLNQLSNILDPARYPPHKHSFIIGIMQKFELCFPLDGVGGRYLIPDLLPKEKPFLNWPDPEKCLLFRYDYHVLPSSVMSRFIVRTHPHIFQNTYWRTGVVLGYQDNKALVEADLEARKITISVIGNEHTRREFLAVIRSNFEHIHRTIPRIEAQAGVPIPNQPNIVADYQHLLTLEQMGEENFVPAGLSERISVSHLLDGVDASRMTKSTEISPRESRVDFSNRSRLREILNRHFSEGELRTLCFDLGVDYEDLPGRGKTSKARELIAYLERRGRLQDLIKIGQLQRPDADWA